MVLPAASPICDKHAFLPLKSERLWYEDDFFTTATADCLWSSLYSSATTGSRLNFLKTLNNCYSSIGREDKNNTQSLLCWN